MSDTYFDRIIDAADVCINCHCKNRVERVDPVLSKGGLRHELDAHYSRDRRETVVDFFDGGDRPTEAKGVWCDCGVEGAQTRIWDPAEVSRDRFKQLLMRTIRILDAKDVTIDEKRTAAHALQTFDECGDIDDALSRGIEQGIARAVTA